MRSNSGIEFITIVGPTASGKTSRAVSLARLLDGEIISGDSRQVYKYMDIGTGKDLEEYENIPYHLIDIEEAGRKYNLHRFLKDFTFILDKLKKEKKNIIFCGGSGLYIESAISGITLPEVPENKELREELRSKSLEELTQILQDMKTLHNQTDIDSVSRAIRAIEIETYYRDHPDLAEKSVKNKAESHKTLIIGIDISREERRKRISQRLKQRIEKGMIEEVKSLLDKGIRSEDLIYYGLEYKYITLFLTGALSFDEMYKKLEIAIHQFAKRQMTWFRGMEKRGFPIVWLPFDLSEKEFNNRVLELTDFSK